ncbi:lipopolysaccharide biosynthesis protein [Geomonas subterranea]|uniref:Lipopolysaccharide biosynthesis protein n=1 Tax=Geomonas subterranea TaxID=2847989 RepID=A0ABX8LKT8_9BACT|nr:Wzz/FepE/Etk N-terminal domain-containing protein [Geomonas subterranea]QXE91531.1 lipopolysaccharide biosynthesis protein [Geomonas subterranea]QXM10380.1 lipopolysaccharide biosynthesis protein [Geomonas subterranea]
MTENMVGEHEGESGILEILHVLAKRKKLIIKICVLAVATTVCYSLTLPNIYSATARVLPPQKEGGGGLSALLGQAGTLAGLAAGSLGGGSDLYLGILRSRSVSDAVVAKLDLTHVYAVSSADAARTRLAGAVKMSAGKDGIIVITADDSDPRLSARLANAFVEELGRATVRLNLTKASTERIFLEKRLELVKGDLKRAEDELKNFAQSNKIVQVEAQSKASIEGIAKLKGELASKEVQLSVLLTKQTEQSPEVKGLKRGIQQLRAEIARGAGDDGGGEGIPNVGNMPGVGLEYSRKLRAVKVQEGMFEQLTKQYEMAKLSEAKDSSSLQILDEAVVPLKKSSPKRSQMVILAGFFSFVFATGLAFAIEYYEKLPDREREKIRRIRNLTMAWK